MTEQEKLQKRRDQLAMAALTGILSWRYASSVSTNQEYYSKVAYRYADAMIKASNQ